MKETVTASHCKSLPCRPLLLTILCTVNLIYCSMVAVVLLASAFFYLQFARWLGSPFNAITTINPVFVRLIMIAGIIIFGCASIGCILMLKMKKTGFWLFAVPAFIVITISLFIVFNPLNLIQLLFISISLILISTQTKNMC